MPAANAMKFIHLTPKLSQCEFELKKSRYRTADKSNDIENMHCVEMAAIKGL